MKEENNNRQTATLLAVLFAFMMGLTVGNIDSEALTVMKNNLFYKEGSSLVSRTTQYSEENPEEITDESSLTSSKASTTAHTEAPYSTNALTSEALTVLPSTSAVPEVTTAVTTTQSTTVTTTEATAESSGATVTTKAATVTSADITAPQTKTTEGKFSGAEASDSDYLTIYRAPTGKRYHYSQTCAGKNSIVTDLDEAEELGLTPCKKCAGG